MVERLSSFDRSDRTVYNKSNLAKVRLLKGQGVQNNVR